MMHAVMWILFVLVLALFFVVVGLAAYDAFGHRKP